MADPAELIQYRPVVVDGYPDAHSVWFVVGVQQFELGSVAFETREHAEWFGGQFRNALLAALSPAPTVPAGFKLVPVEPTEEMCRAASNVEVMHSWCSDGERIAQDSASDLYTAMLAASPQPPVSEGWRDIASAPENVVVLLYTPPKLAWPSGRIDLDFAHRHVHATHWMPLPAPPSAPETPR